MSSRYFAGYATLVVSILVLVIKFWAYNFTGSQAVFSDAVESIVNVVTGITLLITIIYAAKPADDDHPYGHGKAEYFSAALEGGLIIFAGITIVLEAVRSFFEKRQIREIDQGQAIIIVASVINLLWGTYLLQLGKRIRNLAIQASARHLLSDFWTSAGVLVALTLVKFTQQTWIDSLTAIAAAVFLLWNGLKIIFQSMNELMDAGDDKLLSEILEIFKKNLSKGIIRIHHTRVMRSGTYHHIDSHVVVPEFWDVTTSHERTDAFSKKFFDNYSHDGEIHFHVDPCRRAYCRVCPLDKCPVRREEFEASIPLTLEELKSPLEPQEYLQRRNRETF